MNCKTIYTLAECMNAGLDMAFTENDLETAEFFCQRGADLLLIGCDYARDNDNYGPFVEYLLVRGRQDSLDTIMHIGVLMMDVLLIRRCLWLGARNFDLEEYACSLENVESVKNSTFCIFYQFYTEASDGLRHSRDAIIDRFDEVMADFLPVPEAFTEEKIGTREKRKKDGDGDGDGDDKRHKTGRIEGF